MIDLRDFQALQVKAVELTREIMSAQSSALASQSAQFAMVERIRELEQQLMQTETWTTEKQRYKLTDFGCETFAYLLKPEQANGEPSHRICTKCYQSGRKGFLNLIARTVTGREKVECSECHHESFLGCESEPSQPRVITFR
jgi:hypothetical protein